MAFIENETGLSLPFWVRQKKQLLQFGVTMPWIEVRRPTNRHVLASFCPFADYRYQLTSHIHIKVGIDYAWCRRCEAFVESERLWQPLDIFSNCNNLLLLLPNAQSNNREEVTEFALRWNRSRTSPPKCLSCESSFGITKIEKGKVINHPNGDGQIVVGSCGTLGGIPPKICPVYFDVNGKRISN